MADPSSQGTPPPTSSARPKACEACRKHFPSEYRFCPLCARTLRDDEEAALPMGMPGWFKPRILALLALLLVAMTAFGLWRLSLLPASPPAAAPMREAQSPVERRFSDDLADQGFSVRFQGSDRIVIQVDAARWDALARSERFARHSRVGDFRRLLVTAQRELNDATPYRLEVRDRATGKLLAEETDFNLKVYE